MAIGGSNLPRGRAAGISGAEMYRTDGDQKSKPMNVKAQTHTLNGIEYSCLNKRIYYCR